MSRPDNQTVPSRAQIVLLFILQMALVLGMIHLGVQTGERWMRAQEMRRENARIERRLLEVQQENQRLRREAQALQTPNGMEREARRLGYLRPGEVPLIVLPQ
jgi:DNA repair exonuclease SbcCD ATPase subunit